VLRQDDRDQPSGNRQGHDLAQPLQFDVAGQAEALPLSRSLGCLCGLETFLLLPPMQPITTSQGHLS
jgi:hypothetical protein